MNVVKVVILEYSHYKVLNSLFDHTLVQKPYQWCCTVQEILLNLLTFCKFQLFALLCQYCCHGKPFLLSTHNMFRIAFFHHNNLTKQNMIHVYCYILCYTYSSIVSVIIFLVFQTVHCRSIWTNTMWSTILVHLNWYVARNDNFTTI